MTNEETVTVGLSNAAVTYLDGGLQALCEAVEADRGSSSDSTTEELVASELGLSIDEVVDELPGDDEIDTDGAGYATNDLSAFTVIDDCATNVEAPEYPDYLTFLDFPYVMDDGTPESLAGARVIVTAGSQAGSGGTATIIVGETEAEVSANGSWQAIEE